MAEIRCTWKLNTPQLSLVLITQEVSFTTNNSAGTKIISNVDGNLVYVINNENIPVYNYESQLWVNDNYKTLDFGANWQTVSNDFYDYMNSNGYSSQESYQNHLIDPTYFYDAIEEFSFNFTIYLLVGKGLDSYGKQKSTYSQNIVRGSLQSDGLRLQQKLEGNVYEMQYRFYCKSLYRVAIGDIIYYKNKYLRINEVQDYDEYGCRECKATMIQINAYRDLYEYIKYLNGEKLV